MNQSSDVLTPEMLFEGEPLGAAVPAQLRWTQGAVRAAFCVLEVPGHRDELGLWRCDQDEPELWLRAERLRAALPEAGSLPTEAERAARERLRLFSGGITQYEQRGQQPELLITYEGQGFLVSLESGQVQRATIRPERHDSLHSSATGRWLSYVIEGDLWLLDLTHGTERAVTSDASETVSSGQADFIAQEEMHRFAGYWWHPEDRYLAFQRTDDAPIPVAHRHDIQADRIDVIEQRYPYAGGPNASIQLGLYDLESGETRWLTFAEQEGDYLARVDWVQGALWLQVQSRDQRRLWLKQVDPETLASRVVLEERADSWINLHDNLRSAGNGRFLWTSERDDYPRLYLGEVESGALKALTPAHFQVASVLCVAQESVWILGWDETPTEQHLYEVHLQGNHPPRRLSVEGGWHNAAVAQDGTRALMTHSSLTRPPAIGLLDLATATVRTTLSTLWEDHAYRRWLDCHQQPQLHSIAAEDGTALMARLTLPASASSASKVPAIVYVYGGPGAQRVKNEWAPLLLQLLSAAGFAVLELDNRGSHGRGHGFERPIHQALGTIEVADQLCGALWLRRQPMIQEDQIGVFGHSYGGYMTLRCLLAAPEVFTAGVSVAPVTDWTLYDTHYTERYLGDPKQVPESYERAGILKGAERLNRPLQLVHGMADDNVLFGNTTALLAKLQRAKVPFELMTYPGSKHALQESHVQVHRFEALLRFFRQHLKEASPQSSR